MRSALVLFSLLAAADEPATREVQGTDDDELEVFDGEDEGPAEREAHMVELGPGAFIRGMNLDPDPHGEGPAKKLRVKRFALDQTPVTNRQFAQFVDETDLKTEAEKWEWSFVFGPLVHESMNGTELSAVKDATHWLAVPGAYWKSPEGGESNVDGREDYPAVHIAHTDAMAFCKHYGLRLPSETEFEFAARGGLNQHSYPWGATKDDAEKHMNFYQGEFPQTDLGEDGHTNVSPVKAYPANGFGIYDTIGNTWEWTRSPWKTPKGARPSKDKQMALRGGSFVDSIDGKFNHPLRVTTRMGNTPDSSSQNTGFRCAKALKRVKKKKEL